MIFALGAAALMAAHDASRDNSVAIADVPSDAQLPAEVQSWPDPTRTGLRVEATKPIGVARTRSADAHPARVPTPAVPVVEPLKALPETTAVEQPLADSSSRTASFDSTSTASVQNVASVTITGCLEHDDETFWLTATSGENAPTSRSWKSGFLKRRPARVELVDASHALRLTSYVGQRIAATGTLVNHEMQTRSLHRVASTCS